MNIVIQLSSIILTIAAIALLLTILVNGFKSTEYNWYFSIEISNCILLQKVKYLIVISIKHFNLLPFFSITIFYLHKKCNVWYLLQRKRAKIVFYYIIFYLKLIGVLKTLSKLYAT